MIRVATSDQRAGAPAPARARGPQPMTLPDGQAPAGAHIPRLIPLRETVKLSPNATTLRAVRRASIGATLVTAKSGDKAACWLRPRSARRAKPFACRDRTRTHHPPHGGRTNSVVRVMLIMYVRRTSDLVHAPT